MQAAEIIIAVETTAFRDFSAPAEQIEITTETETIENASETTAITTCDPYIYKGLQSINNTQNNILTFMCVSAVIVVAYKVLGWFFNER